MSTESRDFYIDHLPPMRRILTRVWWGVTNNLYSEFSACAKMANKANNNNLFLFCFLRVRAFGCVRAGALFSFTYIHIDP